MMSVENRGKKARGIQEPSLQTRGARLRRAMNARGMNKLSVLAASIGASESAVCRWCNDESMTLDHIERVCVSLNISADWLLLGRGHMDQHRANATPPLAHLYPLMADMAPHMRKQIALFLRMLVAELS